MALLRHVHLPYSVASDEKLLETSQCLGTGVPRRRAIAIGQGRNIGVPRAVVERRMQRGQLIGGPQARVPLYVPYADFFQYQARWRGTAGRPRVSAHGRRACPAETELHGLLSHGSC